MKTIYELWMEGKIKGNLYSKLVGELPKVLNREYYGVTFPRKSDDFTRWEIHELTIKDIFDLFTEEQILKCRGIGRSRLEELKGLV